MQISNAKKISRNPTELQPHKTEACHFYLNEDVQSFFREIKHNLFFQKVFSRFYTFKTFWNNRTFEKPEDLTMDAVVSNAYQKGIVRASFEALQKAYPELKNYYEEHQDSKLGFGLGYPVEEVEIYGPTFSIQYEKKSPEEDLRFQKTTKPIQNPIPSKDELTKMRMKHFERKVNHYQKEILILIEEVEGRNSHASEMWHMHKNNPVLGTFFNSRFSFGEKNAVFSTEKGYQKVIKKINEYNEFLKDHNSLLQEYRDYKCPQEMLKNRAFG